MLQLTEWPATPELEQRPQGGRREGAADAAQAVGMAARAVAAASMPAQANFFAAMRWPGASFSMRWIVWLRRPARWLMKSKRSVTAAKSCPHYKIVPGSGRSPFGQHAR